MKKSSPFKRFFSIIFIIAILAMGISTLCFFVKRDNLTSPNSSAYSSQEKSWQKDGLLPDPKLTPGAVFTEVSVEQILEKGYANRLHGGARHVTEAVKRLVFIAYFGSVPEHPGHYEVDHLISIELGGNNDAKNLWPESYTSAPWNARVKDKLEDRMAANVRHELRDHGHDAATRLLKEYQHEIASDWIAAYQKYVSASPSANP